MKYRVGQKVRVMLQKDFEKYLKNGTTYRKMGERYGVIVSMKKHCGCTVTISGVSSYGKYYDIVEDNGAAAWQDWMLCDPIEDMLQLVEDT